MPPVFAASRPVDTRDTPLPYTASPWKLLSSDLALVWRFCLYIPWMFYPMKSRNGPTDELCLTRGNMFVIAVHVFLLFYQVAFLISLPILVVFGVPVPIFGAYILLAYTANEAICDLALNTVARDPHTGSRELRSTYHLPLVHQWKHRHERWIFLNGIAVGTYWIQNSLNRLSQTFCRPIRGIHTPTKGFVLDLIKCLIQRNFCYATQDVRDAYEQIKQTLWDGNCHKLVLISHSQGGIATSLIVDWLVGEISQEHLQKLELYTFGNAANHFNDPRRSFPGEDGHVDTPWPADRGPAAGQYMPPCQDLVAVQIQIRRRSLSIVGAKPVASSSQEPVPPVTAADRKIWRHIPFIEHYANSDDFVSKCGVIHFIRIRNRYLGHLFQNQASGHLFVQHYLDPMFPLDEEGHAAERNDFMDSIGDIPASIQGAEIDRQSREWHLSRLWRYRGGRSPLDGDGF